MPTPEELNRAAPDTPVFVLFLYSRGFLNQAGLKALGIDENTTPPPGSRYELGPDGKPTGVLLAEPNPTILYQTIGALPGLSEEDQINSTKQFYRELNRFGLASAIDAGGGGHLFPKDYTGTQRLDEAGEMPIRISYWLNMDSGRLSETRSSRGRKLHYTTLHYTTLYGLLSRAEQDDTRR